MNAIGHNPKLNNSAITKTKQLKAAKEAGPSFLNVLSASLAANKPAIQKAKMTSYNIDTLRAISAMSIAPSHNNFGYSMDKDGFMGEDFNQAAGLPNGFKIHSQTLNEIVEFNQKSFIQKIPGINPFDNIDVADTIKQWYKVFKGIVGDRLSGKQRFTSQSYQRALAQLAQKI